MPVSPQTAEKIRIIQARAAIERDPAVLKKLVEALDQAKWEAGKQDAWFFMRALCKTQNENPEPGVDPFQPFPDFEYLRVLLKEWEEVEKKPSDKLLMIPKSRQMMVSWFACAMVLYWCLTKKAKRIGWQGKKAEDTNQMLLRVYGLWERLPKSVRDEHPCEQKFMHLRFPSMSCDIHAIPQGEEQVRQYTWSLFILDEMAFQIDAEPAYYALLPALGKHGMAVAISTAGPGHFETLYADRVTAGAA